MSITVTQSSAPVAVIVNHGSAQNAAPTITAIGFNADTAELVFTFSDGNQIPVTGLASAIAQSLGGNSLAVLDAGGSLILGGKPRLGVSGAGNLTLPTPVPDSTADYTPVSGTNEIYSQAGSLGVAQ